MSLITKSFLSRPEGKIFIAGISLLIIYLSSIVFVYFFSTQNANHLVVMSFINVIFGRAAGISYGFSAHFSEISLIVTNIIMESILVMLVYPLFVLSWNNSEKLSFFHNMMQNVKRQREKYKIFFDKYGKFALFAFVWFPFWMSGPAIGSVIGFLIGIKHYTNMFIVLSGTSLAIVIWTYFLKELISLLEHVSSYAPFLLVGLFIVVALFIKLLNKKRST
jgi:uncharacterized membrane protein